MYKMKEAVFILKVLILWCCFTPNVIAQRILVRPYLQPGNVSDLKKEQKVLIWQTDSVPGNFTVTYNLYGSESNMEEAKPSVVQLHIKNRTTFLYRAILTKLQFDTLYHYEVRLKNNIVARDSFRTRTTKPFTRFAVLGDFGAGTSQQAAIAYRMAEQKPQFVITTGDNAYKMV